MPARRPSAAALSALAERYVEWGDWLGGEDVAAPDRSALATAVRTLLAELAARHPGRALELRVPPLGAIQCGVAGTAVSHSRGTPPNVVETDARTLLRLAAGQTDFATARTSGQVLASGHAADLTGWLPLGEER